MKPACLQSGVLLMLRRCRCVLLLVSLLALAACGTSNDLQRFGPDADQQRTVVRDRIRRCLQATGGRLPTLFFIDSPDEPAVRPTPVPCRGIELQVQHAVQTQMMEDCSKATDLLADRGRWLSDQQRQWAQQQLQRCVGSDPDVFFW
ncbi:MAG: hypothetical protein ACON4T_01450 [Synechococcus sp.]